MHLSSVILLDRVDTFPANLRCKLGAFGAFFRSASGFCDSPKPGWPTPGAPGSAAAFEGQAGALGIAWWPGRLTRSDLGLDRDINPSKRFYHEKTIRYVTCFFHFDLGT